MMGDWKESLTMFFVSSGDNREPTDKGECGDAVAHHDISNGGDKSPGSESLRINPSQEDSLPSDMDEYFAGVETVAELRERTVTIFKKHAALIREMRMSSSTTSDYCERFDNLEAKMSEVIHDLHDLIANEFQDDTGPLAEYVRDVELTMIRQSERLAQIRKWFANRRRKVIHDLHGLIANEFQDDTGPLVEYVRDVELTMIRQSERLVQIRKWFANRRRKRSRTH